VNPLFEDDAKAMAREKGEAVNDLNNEVSKFLTQARADYLSGIPEGELRRISCEIEIGLPGSVAEERKRPTWPTRKLRRTKPVKELLVASR